MNRSDESNFQIQPSLSIEFFNFEIWMAQQIVVDL